MGDFQPLTYAGDKPGADSLDYVLYDSTKGQEYGGAKKGARYVLSLKNSQPGTIKAYGSKDRGKTTVQFAQVAVAAATATSDNRIGLLIELYPDVQIVWTNGGAAQTPNWVVSQGLDDGTADLRAAALSASGGDSGSSSAVTTVQLPAALGQQPKTGSLSVTEASDSPITAAASIRAPLRGEIIVIAPGVTTGVSYNIPDASIAGQPDWRQKIVEVFAEGGDFYLQLSTSTNAVVDDTTVSSTSIVGGRTSLTPSGNEGYPIPRGTSRQIPVAAALSFALKTPVAAAKLRTMLAQT